MSMTKPTFRSRTSLKPASRRGLQTSPPRPFFLFALLLVFLLSLSTTAYSQGFLPYWSASYGSTGFDHGKGIAVDPDGNIIFAGDFQGTIDLGAGPLVSAGGFDVFVAKLSPDGTVIWSQRFGGNLDDNASSVAVSESGDIFICGFFSTTADFGGTPLVSANGYDLFVASYDGTGAHRWSAGYGGTGEDAAYDIATVASGGVVITGSFADSIDFGGSSVTNTGVEPTERDAFVARFADDGADVWSASYGLAGDSCTYVDEKGFGVATDDAGNVYAVVSRIQDWICYAPQAQYAGELVRFDDAGAFQWATTVTSELNDVTVDANGDAIVVGRSRHCSQENPEFTCSGVLARVSPAGTKLWTTAVPEPLSAPAAYPVFDRVATNSAGDIVVAGHFHGTIDLGGGPITSQAPSGDDIVLARYDNGGIHIESRGIPGDGTEIPLGIAMAGDDLLVTGLFTGTIDFGDQVHITYGSRDAFLAKLHSGVSPPPDTDPPGAPTNLVYSAGILTWDAPLDADLDHFSVYMSESMGFDTTATFIQSTPLTTLDVSGLTPAYFYVTALDTAGNESDAARADGPDITAPAPPTNVVYANNVVSWDPSPDLDVDHYTVFASDVFVLDDTAVLAGTTTTTSLYVGGLEPRYFWVTATDFAGNESTPSYGIGPKDVVPPAPPTNFVYDDGILSWDPAPEPDFLNFRIYGSTLYSYGHFVDSLLTVTTDTTLDVHTLPYRYYYARASDQLGNLSASARAIDDVAPPRPPVLELRRGILVWQAPAARDLDHYTVYGSSVDTLDTSAFQLGSTPSTTFDVAQWNMAYFFVTASDHAGNEGAATRATVVWSFALSVYPNPFNPRTRIEYVMPAAGHARIRIYDTRGALISTLVDETTPEGVHTATWTGLDNAGVSVAAGVYFLRLEANGQSATRKIVLLK